MLFRSPERAAELQAEWNRKRQKFISERSESGITGFYDKLQQMRGGRCYWCGCRLTNETRQVDHVIPLAGGGHHKAYNLVLSCFKCNHDKRAKRPNEWIKQGQLVLEMC